MNLILQGLNPNRTDIEAIIALAQPQRVVDINAHAWRCEGVAHSAALKTQIDAACLAQQVDYAFVEAGRTLKDFKLVAMDMDSTLITIECIDEIADMQGLKPQVSEITEAAMRGEIEFNESLTRRVALLKGLDAGALQRVYDERLQLSLGAEKMLQAIQAAGLKTLLVSGGFTFFTDRMKSRLNLDYTHSNELEIVDGKLTGKVVGGIVNAEEKRLTVERVCAELGVPTSQAIVMGDGANDLKMMGVSGLSVAFRAKPVVRAQASVALNFVGLDGILNILAQA
ncbi:MULTISPECIES: phosphoserine phosphatase SerB [unclassified Herbaspirillum]|uniref:phosphoserine phosphatase SerB n=1 Tax=unclassified Herbaspirillum TaxID=2624150 RepID=UPI000E2F83FD|nr:MULTISPECIES: phosphoserine phosphatase SerB [unclassified Herbaspirillum]RFB68771.1 phosphoserine phosphatase SerB [Herbaspirillum sp. 3R-3a1]TFI05678.1 phosphoserine phosphatase SerB [Herbaspirillum sp. 3R11]TFI13411.1 phosphoserine phosphatase SerB [Herbaspirillum sp. 3R-11]TFI20695.1 phosphoserine phosphatase SerB [Herbaspirillum sp. 3C11]